VTEYVNGYALPRPLATLVSAGWWSPRNHRLRLNVPPVEIEERLIALDVPGMIGETQALVDAFTRGAGAVFGLADDGAPPGLLDITQAVVIAVNYGEEFLALDYSVGDVPRVVATADRAEGVRWIEVAARVEDLLDAAARASV
jgi:hypothetical protein